MGLVESQDLVGHLHNETPVPPKFATLETSSPEPQLMKVFVAWQKSDRLLRGQIIDTLSKETLGLVIGIDTTQAVWNALKEEFAQESKEHEFTLQHQLTYLRKDETKSIGEHIRFLKRICANLTAIGKPVQDKEKVFCLLTSLRLQYKTFTTTMLKPFRPTYSELVSQLQNFD